MKRFVSAFFMVLVVFALLTTGTKLTGRAEELALSPTSRGAFLQDYESGTVIYEKNADARHPIASMCKIMTLLLTFEEIDRGTLKETDQITVSPRAASMGGSQVFLDANASYAAGELIKSVAVASANDASVALAEHIAGSVESFVAMMNDRAEALGMHNTNFINATGLPGDGQYSSARDVSTMTRELLSHQKFRTYSGIWMDTVKHADGRETEISNTNKLIRFYAGCDGGKTGYTHDAKHCLSATATRGGMRLIATVLGAPDSKTRFAEVRSMLDFGFANYECRKVLSKDEPLSERAAVQGGKEREVSLYAARDHFVFAKKRDKADCTVRVEVAKVKAPVKKGDEVGILRVVQNGMIVEEIPVLAGEDVAKSTLFDVLKDAARNWGFLKNPMPRAAE